MPTAGMPSLAAWFRALGVCVALGLPLPGRGLIERGYLAHLPMPTAAAVLGHAEVGGPVPEFGIGAYLETTCPHPEVEPALGALSTLPVAWVRQEIPWAGVEPRAGEWQWDRWDRVVDAYRQRGLRVVGMLCYWGGGVATLSPGALPRWERYCRRVAERYRGKIAAWEVWNEPNEPNYWPGTVRDYGQFLAAAFRAVKAADADAMVLGGSLSGVDLKFLRALHAGGWTRFADGWSVHPYLWGWSPEDAHHDAELRGLSRWLRSQGLPARPWITEFGLPTGDQPKQLNYFERALILQAGTGSVSASIAYALLVPGAPGYSFFDPGWREKPVAGRFRSTAVRLRGATSLGRRLRVPPPRGAGTPYALRGVQVWGFKRDREVSVVSWSTRGQVKCTLPGLPAQLDERPNWSHPSTQLGRKQ